ncbi:Spo0B domain-containing protein [Salinibacillus xinjiangensis]|uniref:SpoOB alpha-helical domain-containing protein n=1 Tax=Salinibacillus xinjiangensis TaxID=1229268 RepID=A0A6G1XBC4_9BACI|nr:Spo0B domain-containing protein [Salinibacillus xinjiangensis]MRG88232.1 hypothetical protein [Salinibacillus xinjiangensis]
MRADEVIEILRHYRHDLLNDLQLIQGYAQMDNMKMVKEKTQNLVKKTMEERKLSNLNCPHFTLWVMNFHSTYKQFRLDYEVNVEKADMSSNDLTLLAISKEIMQQIHKHISKEQLYTGKIVFYETNQVYVDIIFNGPIYKIMELKSSLDSKTFVHNVEIDEEECHITLSLQKDS